MFSHSLQTQYWPSAEDFVAFLLKRMQGLCIICHIGLKRYPYNETVSWPRDCRYATWCDDELVEGTHGSNPLFFTVTMTNVAVRQPLVFQWQ